MSNILVEWKSFREFSTTASITASSLFALWLYFFTLVESPPSVKMMIRLVVGCDEQIVFLTGVLNLYTRRMLVSRLEYPSWAYLLGPCHTHRQLGDILELHQDHSPRSKLHRFLELWNMDLKFLIRTLNHIFYQDRLFLQFFDPPCMSISLFLQDTLVRNHLEHIDCILSMWNKF